MSKRLQGKTILVTGAAGGLGEAFARAIDAEGGRMVLTDLAPERIEDYAGQLNGVAMTVGLDVTRSEAWRALMQQIETDLGALHGLIHNAGVGTPRPFMDIDADYWRRMMSVNLDSVLIGSQAAMKLLVASGGGSIVNISSVAGIVSGAGMAAYSAAKGAVRLLTKSMAVEFALGKIPVRVNSVHPAFTRTAMVQDLIDASEDPVRMEARLARNSAQRRIAEPAEIAGVVVHLLSDESSFTTGAEHVVDGGLTAM